MATWRSARRAELKARSYEGGKIDFDGACRGKHTIDRLFDPLLFRVFWINAYHAEFEHTYLYDFTSQDVRSTDNYHRGLFRFFVRQMVNYEKKKAEESGRDSSMVSVELFLSVLQNPDTPSVMTVQNKHGDMVRILCEEDFVAALSGYHSWEMCLLIEGYNYKPAPTVSRYQATPAQRVQPGVGVSAQRHQAGRRAVHQRAFQFGRRFGEEVAQANQEHIHNMFNVATGMMFGCKPCGTALGTWCDCHGE